MIMIADRGRVGDAELTRRIEEALRAGAPALQLRDKTSTPAASLDFARRLAEACRKHNALFFLNDRLDVALAADADGVHLGPDDLPVAAARSVAGPGFLIGASTGLPEEAVRAVAAGADYLGCGSVFATGSKPNAGDPIGLEGLQAVVEAVALPVIAIGGVTPGRAASVRGTGAAGTAAISALLGPRPVDQVVKALLEPWER